MMIIRMAKIRLRLWLKVALCCVFLGLCASCPHWGDQDVGTTEFQARAKGLAMYVSLEYGVVSAVRLCWMVVYIMRWCSWMTEVFVFSDPCSSSLFKTTSTRYKNGNFKDSLREGFGAIPHQWWIWQQCDSSKRCQIFFFK